MTAIYTALMGIAAALGVFIAFARPATNARQLIDRFHPGEGSVTFGRDRVPGGTAAAPGAHWFHDPKSGSYDSIIRHVQLWHYRDGAWYLSEGIIYEGRGAAQVR